MMAFVASLVFYLQREDKFALGSVLIGFLASGAIEVLRHVRGRREARQEAQRHLNNLLEEVTRVQRLLTKFKDRTRLRVSDSASWAPGEPNHDELMRLLPTLIAFTQHVSVVLGNFAEGGGDMTQVYADAADLRREIYKLEDAGYMLRTETGRSTGLLHLRERASRVSESARRFNQAVTEAIRGDKHG